MIIVVCSALITQEDRVLLVHENKMDKFGLPGGKLEAGESLRACLARELREEIGAETRINDLIMTTEKPQTHEGNTVIRFIYTADIVSQEANSELTYGYYDQAQVTAMASSGKLRGKDVEHLLEAFFASKIQPIPEPLQF